MTSSTRRSATTWTLGPQAVSPQQDRLGTKGIPPRSMTGGHRHDIHHRSAAGLCPDDHHDGSRHPCRRGHLCHRCPRCPALPGHPATLFLRRSALGHPQRLYSYRDSAVHPAGRTVVACGHYRTHVLGLVGMAQSSARRPAPHQYRRLFRVCRDVRLVGGDRSHHRHRGATGLQ